MYLLRMDQLAKEDITAAAHHELGPHFDGAVAESLIERIGEEIDKRVDSRLGGRDGRRVSVRRRPAGLERSVQHSWQSVVLALGSMGIGIGATAIVLKMSQSVTAGGAVSNSIGAGQILLCVLIWVVIGLVNSGYNRRS
jgi:plasmid stabilization system protein ParE